jgi:hypothetical protein
MNGEVVASREVAAGTRELSLSEKIRVTKPGWIAARCASELGRVSGDFFVPAHTSPVYLVVPGQEPFSAETVAYMLAQVDGSQAYVENLGVRPRPGKARAGMQNLRGRSRPAASPSSRPRYCTLIGESIEMQIADTTDEELNATFRVDLQPMA